MTGRGHRLGAVLALVALGTAASACRGGDGRGGAAPTTTTATTTTTTVTSTTVAAPWASEPTRRCLEGGGATVAPLQARDPRLQALRDLAQQTSFEVRLGDAVVGVAVTAGTAPAQQLADLLLVPDDPYRVVVDRNVVAMYRPASEPAFRATVACLRE